MASITATTRNQRTAGSSCERGAVAAPGCRSVMGEAERSQCVRGASRRVRPNPTQRGGRGGTLVGVPAAFDSSRTWDFPVPADELWDRIAEVQDYRRWWPWLRRFEPGRGL